MTTPNDQSKDGSGNPTKPAQFKDSAGPIPAELTQVFARRAKELAKEPVVEVEGQTVKLLVFWLNGERYGIDVSNVREIHPAGQLTPVPRTPNFSAGVFSARGRILSVIDLGAFLGLPGFTSQTETTKIIIVSSTTATSESANMEIGLLADEVADVVTIFENDIEPPLTTHTGIQTEYLQGVTSDLLVILNLNALLSDKRLIIHEEII